MRAIPTKMLKEMLADPAYSVCARKEDPAHTCAGRITLEHAIIYGDNQVNAKWAIVPLCALAHEVDQFQDGGDLDKERNEWIALCRASDADILALTNEMPGTPPHLSKAKDIFQKRKYLQGKFGIWVQPIVPKTA